MLNNKLLIRNSINLKIAFEAVLVNKVRTFLTALGIIFGVAAVISMLAIGNGAKKQILEQMKMIGVNNIIVKAKEIELKVGQNEEEQSKSDEDEKSKENLSAGLSIFEAYSIKKIIPTVQHVSVESKNELSVMYMGLHTQANLTGVNEDFFHVFSLELEKGKYITDTDNVNSARICVLGHNIKNKLFPTSDAIGKDVKCGNIWYKVVGVLEQRGEGSSIGDDVGVNNFDMAVYIPINSYLTRHNDKSRVTKQKLAKYSEQEIDPNRNQLQAIVVQVDDPKNLKSTAELIDKILKRKHSGADDYSISIPELLLKQEQKTRNIFNIVLGAIASISLIVGGIGIMNIMLASVIERTKEIGIRRSIGATGKDVVFQFIAEASIISLMGGIVGVILGFILSYLIEKMTDIPTIVSWFSVLLSFVVAASVGIIFGFMPAKKAAREDIIVSLRHE